MAYVYIYIYMYIFYTCFAMFVLCAHMLPHVAACRHTLPFFATLCHIYPMTIDYGNGEPRHFCDDPVLSRPHPEAVEVSSEEFTRLARD